MFTHIMIGTNDLERSRAFYDATLGALGIAKSNPALAGLVYLKEGPFLGIRKPRDGKPATAANGGTIGLRAPSRRAVREFHAAALATGGTDEGAPGPRDFVSTAYAAYVRDPDGNKLCAICLDTE